MTHRRTNRSVPPQQQQNNPLAATCCPLKLTSEAILIASAGKGSGFTGLVGWVVVSGACVAAGQGVGDGVFVSNKKKEKDFSSAEKKKKTSLRKSWPPVFSTYRYASLYNTITMPPFHPMCRCVGGCASQCVSCAVSAVCCVVWCCIGCCLHSRSLFHGNTIVRVYLHWTRIPSSFPVKSKVEEHEEATHCAQPYPD